MKAVILAGGLGTRLREETEYKPKPMVEIGGKPILWHLMKILSTNGINEFIVCLGYKGEQIKNFFLNYKTYIYDSTIYIGSQIETVQHNGLDSDNWSVTLVDTGSNTLTGGRLAKIRNYIGKENFLCTYGDGLSNINIHELKDFHNTHGKIATVTAVRPISRFGHLRINDSNTVTSFEEKPISSDWVNGGFFIFKPEIFNFLDSDCSLELEPLKELSHLGELKSYKHNGFWQPMDTYREFQYLNEMWEKDLAPWKIWS